MLADRILGAKQLLDRVEGKTSRPSPALFPFLERAEIRNFKAPRLVKDRSSFATHRGAGPDHPESTTDFGSTTQSTTHLRNNEL